MINCPKKTRSSAARVFSVGTLDGVEIYHPESFLTFEHQAGTVHLYRDLSRLKESWLELSLRDERIITDFCGDIERLHGYEIPFGKPTDLMGPVGKIRYWASMKEAGLVMRKYGKISLKEYASKFHRPALRMMNRYLALGGNLETSCEATGLRIDHNKVFGVRCNNGKVFESDYIIAACDARVLYERLLGSRHNDRQFQKRYRDPANYPLASEIRVALGYTGRDTIMRICNIKNQPFIG